MARVVCVDQVSKFEIGSILTGASPRNKQTKDISGLAYATCTDRQEDRSVMQLVLEELHAANPFGFVQDN